MFTRCVGGFCDLLAKGADTDNTAQNNDSYTLRHILNFENFKNFDYASYNLEFGPFNAAFNSMYNLSRPAKMTYPGDWLPFKYIAFPP